MKRALWVLALLVMFGQGYAAQTFNGKPVYQWSTAQTADAQIVTGQGALAGICAKVDGTNTVTVDFYDNTSATEGTNHLPKSIVFAASPTFQCFGIDPPVYFSTGLYADITTSGTVTYQVNYDR